jgi:hypothetical protein
MHNPVLAKATEHFKERISGNLNEYHVDAWDTTVYFKTVNSFKDESKILQLHQQGKMTEALVESLIVKCRNKDGSKMFKPADKVTLLNEVDPAIIIEVATAINEASENYQMNIEETEKN